MTQNNPLAPNSEEYRLRLRDGKTMILTIQNLPVMPTYDALLAAGRAAAEELSNVAESGELQEARAKMHMLNHKIAEVEVELSMLDVEDEGYKEVFTKYQTLSDQLLDQSKVVALLSKIEPAMQWSGVSRKTARGLMSALFPNQTIDDEVIDALSFADLVEIWERLVRVNRWDLLPKLIPQRLKEWAAAAISGGLQ